ncbi:alpha-ketoglutarate-dependent dioxygenase alkB [Olea europaea subsp. europaea]|uniref:Alpha-ketoglutarate-dependent dioxygenase alkB n=1 Tax=Olea europaea subsp. europaea TaxID=158383 RepID=A0A8S0SHF6_OLEEU|nr:alpha-ketoglutarate-dependent dioxygenase alkB [Olea europaea subsp. europaea]
MYGAEPVNEESERTAFRKAEKKYKIYYENAKKKKIPRSVDLSEVIDFRSILESFKGGGDLPAGVFELKCDFNQPVFGLVSRPGFYFIPAALSIEEQCHWIRESLTSFPQPPNRTNHNAIYGPLQDLFLAAKEGKVLIEEDTLAENIISEANLDQSNVNTPRWKYIKELDESFSRDAGKSVSASVLLRKLRWSTLGLQFDWSKRSYNIALPHKKIPDKLCMLAKRMAAPAMPCSEEFHPEAAIVNYFGLGDMLGGHLDDMEKDWSKPIVSISLGCKAIFLLGGKSRDHTPIAMFLQSGDAVLMAGEARECFHGVPRIFTDPENAEIGTLESQFSDENNLPFLDYIRTSRVNINIRQVF